MTVRVDLNGLLEPALGAAGIAPAALEQLTPELVRARTILAAQRAEGALVVPELPHRRDDLRRIRDLAAMLRTEFDTLVVLGTGGSAVAVRALISALPPASGLDVRLVDSVDPDVLDGALSAVDFQRTLFNVVSSTGDTAETMAQFLIVRARLLHALGAVDYKRHVLVTTVAEQGSLRQIVNDEGFRDLIIPSGVDGRFAALTAIGLLPAAAAGTDIDDVCAGAAAVDDRAQTAESPLGDPALVLAGALWLLGGRQRARVGLQSYCRRLDALGDWAGTLWGPGDPRRQEVTLFLHLEKHAASIDVPPAYQDLENVGYLGGLPLGAVLDAERRATEYALARRGRPSATISLPVLNGFAVGQLIHLLQMAALTTDVLAGPAAALDDTPRIVGGILGRPGCEAARNEIDAWTARRDPRFVL